MPTVVQTATCSACGGAQSFPGNVVANNLIVATAAGMNTGAGGVCPTATISDSQSNTYTQVNTVCQADTTNNQWVTVYIWYTNAASSAALGITVTWTNAPNGKEQAQYEVSGATGTGSSSSTGTGSGAPPTAASTGSLSFSGSPFLVAFLGLRSTANLPTVTVGTGFTSLAPSINSNGEYAVSGITSPTTFPYSFSGGTGTTDWAEVGAQFPAIATAFFESGSKRFYRRFSGNRAYDTVGSMLSLQGIYPSWLLRFMQALVLFKVSKALSPTRR